MPNIMNTSDLVGAYVGSNQVTSLYMGSQYLWGEEIVTADTATTLDCFDNMYFDEGIECSSVTISFIKMYNSDPFFEGDWSEVETVGTITCEYYENAQDPELNYWYIASSAVTSAITSAEMYHDEDHGWMMRVVSPVLNDACDPTDSYKFKALATTTNGLATADLYDENNYATEHCSNEYLTIDWSNATWLKILTVTNVPTFGNLSGDMDRYSLSISVSDSFDFTHEYYYDMTQEETVNNVSFDNYNGGNLSYTYDQSAHTLTVLGDWDDYDGEGNGEYVLTMRYEHQEDYTDNRHGRLPLRFTGNSETIQFTACYPQCDAVLYLDFTVPSDNNEHTFEVTLDGDTVATLTISYDGDVLDYQEEYDADGYYYSMGVSDMGNGKVLWDVEGPFSGACDISVDGTQLLNGNPTFGGGYTIWYVDVDSDDKKEYPNEDAFSCEFWDGGTWDDINQDCIYPE